MSNREVNVVPGRQGFQPGRVPVEQRASAPAPAAAPSWMTVPGVTGGAVTVLTDQDMIGWADRLRLGSFDAAGQFVLEPGLDPWQVSDCHRRQQTDADWATLPAGTRLLHPSSIRRRHGYESDATFEIEFVAYRDGQIDYRELGGTAVFTLPADARHTTRLTQR